MAKVVVWVVVDPVTEEELEFYFTGLMLQYIEGLPFGTTVTVLRREVEDNGIHS